MKPRMLCTDCFETSAPQTLLPGSDRVELIGWLCLALPGWLYCAWRHALRIKACGVCGGFALVREARAAAALGLAGEAAPSPPPIRALRGGLRWPRPFLTPRERLHAGAAVALAVPVALICAGLAVVHPAQVRVMASLAAAAMVLAVFGLGNVLRQWLHQRAFYGLCRAWLPDGREIHVERV